MSIDRCPECRRPKARNVQDALIGYCPKWWAIRDQAAKEDCEQWAAQIGIFKPLLYTLREVFCGK